ncbi:MAG: CDP-alcohol phosphatidyltransferase family protein [Gammaproteobacteria bacterium CG_4_10_14_0_8_um_filter_38_16]|nr:MAG: CDP-alcohol phosphatidyltransferase family protein [Gammaproteobacteria bacterium CG_4_10_14_0_8_um_filter_38_16]PJA03560.1 MAG: CDP-alcohol phosphatidyltransferase family protein [Gammaproteobacteria bacterium CG_4_10_14_0_2_um_filter_38_22]PJB09943.1 MAG: CDP-alcohol phosphatidyltransferase family protein [Gammaproteobacteria bacterium CG_4_9_14_3_um_filter_38_9]
MLESYLRSHYQKYFVDNVAKYVAKYATPNQITLLSLCTGVCILPALIFHQRWIGVILLILTGYLDMLDGTLARLRSCSSEVGAMLDILSDRVVEAAAIMGLYFVNPMYPGFLSLLMLSSILICITSFLVVGIFTQNNTQKSFYYSPGLIERAEAFIFFAAMMIFPSLYPVLAILFSILVFYTAADRIHQFVFSKKLFNFSRRKA